MESLENQLIDKENGLIKLLDPPFEKSKIEPGYIKAYLPGVRENGGQYTHAAMWAISAFTKLGFGDKDGAEGIHIHALTVEKIHDRRAGVDQIGNAPCFDQGTGAETPGLGHAVAGAQKRNFHGIAPFCIAGIFLIIPYSVFLCKVAAGGGIMV